MLGFDDIQEHTAAELVARALGLEREAHAAAGPIQATGAGPASAAARQAHGDA